MHHVGLILQISGFVIAALFGTILLNKEIVGKWADAVNEAIATLSIRLQDRFVSMSEYLLRSQWPEKVSPTIIMTIGEVCAIVGISSDITWLFWLGVAIIAPYLIIGMPFFFFIEFRERFSARSIWLLSLYFILQTVGALTFGPITLILALIYFSSFTILTLIFTVLASNDAIRKTAVIVGSIMIIIGLILEATVVW